MIQECFNCGEPTEFTLVGTATFDDHTGVYSIPLCQECEEFLEETGSGIEEIREEIVRQVRDETIAVI